jgi:hypothetical protein
LANIESTCSPIPDGVFYEVITQWSIKIKTLAPPEKSTADSGATSQDATEDIIVGPK